MSYEFALYLGSAAKVGTIATALPKAFGHGNLSNGSEIIKALSPYVPPNLRSPTILLLIREGVLRREKAAPTIESMVLRLDSRRSDEFFSAQEAAAKIIEEAGIQSAVNTSKVEVVATIPAEKAIGKRIVEIGSIDGAIRRLIVSSSKRVSVVNPFFDAFGAAAISDALIGRAEKGVQVRVIGRELMGDRGEETRNVQPIQWLYDRFKESGLEDQIEVRDFAKRDASSGQLVYALHSKIVLSDANACYIGSANVTETSLRFNFELGVVLKDELVEPVAQLVGHLWDESTRVFLT
jgi:cardiolipin synthase/putative cardiolipin synthase